MPHYHADVIALDMDRDFRLHQLREEFEATVERAKQELYACDEHDLADWLAALSADEVANWKDRPDAKGAWIMIAARRYIIARDFNVFEDGRWQMLWKLTYGGAL